MAKPGFLDIGGAAAWGDLAEISEPMLGNLFAVSIRLPTALKALYPTGGPVVSMLAVKAELPDEELVIAAIKTKLSDYDVVVGKKRGELGFTFRDQVGAPVASLFDAWHRLACDARGAGIGFPSAYKSEVWVAALTGDGVPYFWWGFKRAFPLGRGKYDFGNEDQKERDIAIKFSYLQMMDVSEKMTGEGGLMMNAINSAAVTIGV
jgi:hypothetical protein